MCVFVYDGHVVRIINLRPFIHLRVGESCAVGASCQEGLSTEASSMDAPRRTPTLCTSQDRSLSRSGVSLKLKPSQSVTCSEVLWMDEIHVAPHAPWTPLFIGMYRRIKSLQGFLAGAGFRPSTVWNNTWVRLRIHFTFYQ